jgi:hypothetical protein
MLQYSLGGEARPGRVFCDDLGVKHPDHHKILLFLPTGQAVVAFLYIIELTNLLELKNA